MKDEIHDKSIVFLGDNIYSGGLHSKNHPQRSKDETLLNAQINLVKDINSPPFLQSNKKLNEIFLN